MATPIRDSLFGKMSERDAREIYLPLMGELENIYSMVSEGDWKYLGNKSTYFKLFSNHRIRLLSDELQKRLSEFHDQSEKFQLLALTANKKLKQIFGQYHTPGVDEKGGLSPFRSDINFLLEQTKNLKKLPKNNFFFFNIPETQYLRLKKETSADTDIGTFIRFKKKIQDQIFDLSTDLLKAYKKDTLAKHSTVTVLTIISIVLTLVLVGVTGYSVSKSNELIDRQIESLSPVNPELRIFGGARQSDLYFDRSQLARPLSFFNDSTLETWNKEWLYLVIQNVGQLPAGYVNVRVASDYLHIPGQHLENLSATSTQGINFQIWKEGCSQGNTAKDCNPLKIPTGKFDLSVAMNCQYCRKEFNETITICIYEGNIDECSS